MSDRLMTTKEAARHLTVSHRTIERWRLIGHGPEFRRAGRKRIVYSLSDLELFLGDRFRAPGVKKRKDP